MNRLITYTIAALLCWGCQEDNLPPQNIPVISNVTISGITDSTALCTFTVTITDAIHSVGINYGTDSSQLTGDFSIDDISGNTFTLPLNNLVDEMVYYYKVYVRDKMFTFIYSEIGEFKTQSSPYGSTFSNGITPAGSFRDGDGSRNNPYLIANAQQLKKLVDDVNNGNRYYNTFFQLTTDIQITADEWIPIGTYGYTNDDPNYNSIFSGIFDGGGHTISGTMKSQQFKIFGFIGYAYGCNISNLIIDASVINEYDIINYPTSTGSIIGRCEGDTKINNCILKGTVKGGNGYMSITGGILGTNFGTIVQSCSVSGIVNGGIAMKVEGENYGGDAYTGGIIGYNCGDMMDCTVSGTVNGGMGTMVHTGGIVAINFNHINSCTVTPSALINGGETGSQNYTGGIVGFNYVGGLAGYNNGEIHTSLNNGNISGADWSTGGLAGYNSAHIYSCCTNSGTVNGQIANENNQIGNGKPVETCPDGHTKR